MADWAIIDIADLHCGDRLALAPLGFQFDEGGRITLSSLNLVQHRLWLRWCEAWKWIDTVSGTRKRIIRLLGDLVDGQYHAKVQMLTRDMNEQRRMAVELLKAHLSTGDEVVVIRGTEAHDGLSGQDAEAIAQSLGVQKDEQAGCYSVYHSLLDVNGVLLSAAHAIGVSHSPVTDFSALAREWLKATRDAVQWGTRMPSIITRAHRHQYNYVEYPARGPGGRQAVFTLPCWQARTGWAYRSGVFSLPQIGVVVTLVDNDGSWNVMPRIWNLPGPVVRKIE